MTKNIENSPQLTLPPRNDRGLLQWSRLVFRDLSLVLSRISNAINSAWRFEGFITPDELTADVDNYNPSTVNGWRLSSDATRSITGIDGGREGRIIVIANVGSNNIDFENESGSSEAENRIITGSGVKETVAPAGALQLVYDGTSLRWRIIAAK